MGSYLDISGQRFGQLTAVSPTEKRQHGNVVWLCTCSCGAECFVNTNRLRFGITKSCGCRKLDVLRARNYKNAKHFHARTYKQTPTYKSWSRMLARCYNPRVDSYENYGARGITVCERWRIDFRNFLSDMGERPRGMTIDRVNVDGNYEPGNCRWAGVSTQQRNRRNNHLVTFKGETLCLATWSEKVGVPMNTLRMRLSKGWTVEETMTIPVLSKRQRRPPTR